VVLISDYVSVPSSIAGQQLGRYLVVEKIGAGGMGVVYRAHDQQLDRDVALKVLPPATLADKATRGRFHQEALAIAKLSHPNVAMAFDHGQEEGIDFIVTEYIPESTLNAPAYAALGQTYWIGYDQLNKGKQWFVKASSNCDKAQTINSALAEAHTCRFLPGAAIVNQDVCPGPSKCRCRRAANAA
jgi:serine/threonine protein kinase